ncbi:MAG TPA: Mth938-like domain-containing protein [Rubrobacteraceae bacterium]|nr:Mth938-like domain-containing protein [Rubrobacteraceae bacterium]
MEGTLSSPGVTGLSWGRVEVEGRDAALRDARLYPGGSREWDWNETGTRHAPGVGPADVEELLERGADVVVISRGFHGRLGVREETLRMLGERGVDVHVLLTEEAVRLYNRLREAERVGALIHSTC